MNIVKCEGNEAFARAANEWCKQNIARVEARSIFVPAGASPEPLYSLWEKEKPEFLTGIDLLQIDDVATGSKRGLFGTFFSEKLPSYQNQMRCLLSGGPHRDDACNRIADLAILGLGLNGHVAFHEPGLDRGFVSGCVRLSEVTCRNLSLTPNTWGITYGAGAFRLTKGILMIVKGAGKREILKKLLERDQSLPASSLLDHPSFTLLTDYEALPGGSV